MPLVISDIPIVIPDEKTLKDFEVVSEPIISMILQKSLDSKRLADTRDAILPCLIAGDLAIPELMVVSWTSHSTRMDTNTSSSTG